MKRMSAITQSTLISMILLADAKAEVLPGSVLPEQVGRSIEQQQPERAIRPLPTLEAPKAEKGTLVGEQAKKITFQLNSIILEGNHVYSSETLRDLYRDKIGKKITVAQLFEIVQSITNYYRNNGYVLSRALIPPQHVKNGNVKIRVIEGYIDQVTVSGNPHRACGLVQAMGNQIKCCPPLQLKRMEKYLYLLNEIPGTSVKGVIAASKKTTGAADLTLVTDNHPITGYLSYDNFGTRYIGPQQMGAHLALNSSLISGDQLAATLSKTPKGRELTFGDLNYSVPLGLEGIRWQTGITAVYTNPLFILADTKIHGNNQVYYTQITLPILREKNQQLTLRTGFNYVDSWVDSFGFKIYTDHIRSLNVGATYLYPDRWNGFNIFQLDVREGLPIFGYTSNTNILTAQTSRPGGHADYTKIFFMASRTQPIVNKFSLYGVFQGQLSFSPLLASDQFTFGGSQLGRGYDAAELIGDQGLAGSLEGRYDWLLEKKYLNSVQLYAFYDAGVIDNFHFISGAPKRSTAMSTGLGGRFAFTRWLSGGLMWTQPLTKQVSAEALAHRGKNSRVFFNLAVSFD